MNKARRSAELRVPQPYSTQTAQRPRINTVPSDKAPHFVCPSARRITYSPTNVQPHQPSVKTTAETWPAQRLSRKSAIFSPSIRQGDYRILTQDTSCSISGLNTVLSDKSIPYPPARNYRTLRQISASYGPSYDPHESIGQELPANQAFLLRLALHARIPYSPTSFTVLPHKEYRTLQQGIPYSPTRDTVPSDKFCRTPQQNIPYSPASSWRYLPANSDKGSCDRFALTVVVFC